ncbi:hypothetical protein ACO2Q3_22565 [Caulobacter sp. KR2-114]|uniref:hypothetical protein n=1 Tax=Caulobacter sp. KR2-114 TaxID=3400912 RepID=UPI003C0B4E3A
MTFGTAIRTLAFNLACLGLVGLFAVGAVRLGWKTDRLLTTLAAAMVCGFLGNLDRVKSFRAGAGGLQAETHAVVAEAKSTIIELRRLGTTLGTTLVTLIAGEGRYGGLTAAKKDELKEEVLASLRAIDVPKPDVESIAALDRQYVIVDYCEAISDQFRMPGVEGPKAWNAFWSRWTNFERPQPSELRSFLESLSPIEPWREALLVDYEHYIRTGKHRRPHLWKQRGEWAK